MSFKRYLAGIALAGSIALPAFAHDVWLVPANGDWKLVYGHYGDLVDYDPAKTRAVTGYDAAGNKLEVSHRDSNGELLVSVPADAVMVTVTFDNGYFTKGPDEKTVHRPKNEVPGYLSSSHNKKFHKSVMGWSDVVGKPTGAEFEIVPLTPIDGLEVGDELKVQVLFKGKPAAGVDIEMLGNMDLFQTGADGTVVLPIGEGDEGLQYIMALHDEDVSDSPDTDRIEHMANLLFSL